jgi:hypothetical protein
MVYHLFSVPLVIIPLLPECVPNVQQVSSAPWHHRLQLDHALQDTTLLQELLLAHLVPLDTLALQQVVLHQLAVRDTTRLVLPLLAPNVQLDSTVHLNQHNLSPVQLQVPQQPVQPNALPAQHKAQNALLSTVLVQVPVQVENTTSMILLRTGLFVEPVHWVSPALQQQLCQSLANQATMQTQSDQPLAPNALPITCAL